MTSDLACLEVDGIRKQVPLREWGHDHTGPRLHGRYCRVRAEARSYGLKYKKEMIP